MKSKLIYLGAFIFVGVVYFLIVSFGPPNLQGFNAFWQTVIAISAIRGNEIKALFLGPKLVLELDRPRSQAGCQGGKYWPSSAKSVTCP